MYPRRAELEQEADCVEPLKQLGRYMEDGHVLFDMILEAQLVAKGDGYAALVLPGIERLTAAEGAFLRRYVAGGGKVVFAGTTGDLDVDGTPHAAGLLADWRSGVPAGVQYLGKRTWGPEKVALRPEQEVLVYPVAQRDALGRQFLKGLNDLLGAAWLETDAPWFVRVRAWQPDGIEALVLHWVNYRQDESSDIEVPQPVGPLQVSLAVPDGQRVERVEWLYPEREEAVVLPHHRRAGRVDFKVPSLIVYGLSVVYLD